MFALHLLYVGLYGGIKLDVVLKSEKTILPWLAIGMIKTKELNLQEKEQNYMVLASIFS